jgi:tetratricopeptide (TPR) repeat protein
VGDYGRVLEIAEEMVSNETTPQQLWGLNLIGLVYLRYARWYEDDHRYETAKKYLERAIGVFEYGLRNNPNFSLFYINAGWALLRLENLIADAAERNKISTKIGDIPYDRAMDRFKKSICAPEPFGRKVYADSYGGLGFVYFAKGELPSSLEKLEESFSISPNQFDPRDSEDVYFGLYRTWINISDSEKRDAARRMRECRYSGHNYDYCKLIDAAIWEGLKKPRLPIELANVCGVAPAAYLAPGF